MRFSALHAPTLKEAPKEAEVPSHRLLLRAGFIRKLAAGIYDFLPLAIRSLTKISNIIREELEAAGAQEVFLPAVQPAELWQESGRWEQYGPELLRLKDRKDTEFCVGPTHEEVIVDLVRRDVRSYKQLPLNLFQIQSKFRDELRPRAGLMRGREFMMKDAYSFDTDDESAHESYRKMAAAYRRIFERCGLDFRVVDADSGNIGGSLSQEFQVLAETGEDAIVACDTCDYSANVEMAPVPPLADVTTPTSVEALELVDTPKASTIAEVSSFFGVEAEHVVKTLVFEVDGRLVAAMVRGDHELNEVKLKRQLGAENVALATEKQVRDATGAPVGFAGPVGLRPGVELWADHTVSAGVPFVVGANAGGKHFRNAVLGRDFEATGHGDLRVAVEGDPCPKCHGTLRPYRGIEVGHVFFLGTKYTEPMKCNYLNKDGKDSPMVMGCYGIGVTRTLAAAVEQHHDEKGIAWPVPIAPYHVVVVGLNANDDEVMAAAETLYDELRAEKVQVLFDDRKGRPGAKLKDAELIGIPYCVVVGRRGLNEGQVEFRSRGTGESASVPVGDAKRTVLDALEAAGAR